MMNNLTVVLKRELSSYFATPVAYVFIVIFLALMGAFTFYLGNFYERGSSDLDPFFQFHPWLYLFLVPAVSMRLWAEERRAGTVELLLTLPLTTWQAVLGKFLAAWLFVGIALALIDHVLERSRRPVRLRVQVFRCDATRRVRAMEAQPDLGLAAARHRQPVPPGGLRAGRRRVDGGGAADDGIRPRLAENRRNGHGIDVPLLLDHLLEGVVDVVALIGPAQDIAAVGA